MANSSENGNLYYAFDEHRAKPIRRSYAEYLASADEATDNVRKKRRVGATAEEKKLLSHVGGVLGRWCLDRLPYAALIFWTMDMMHTFCNVIHNILDTMRPTRSAITGVYYAHSNRCNFSSILYNYITII